ncbi:glycosyl hydrolase catalytic core-domain-containing protein [Boletus reticuloceps]|uniref:Glycosyl hydrolase catalytic core-domain-containing protein n=1 Tax=Boletus reticuloceps TaxID=495285 RepID=A0A8I2YIA6_9AGAM|nr:glycosyl hydrolase catalytic core-domain-containing protein [Boletus reticuloceps]
MTRSLLFPSLVLWFCLSTIPSRTLAESKPDTTHVSPFFDEHQLEGASIHGHEVHDKRKRGGRNSLLKRCDASKHSHGSKTPASAQYSNSVFPAESKKWGLAWPNGDALYTWSPYLPFTASEHGMEGIPMLWGWSQVDDFSRVVIKGYATKVLGMNEPNEPTQSFMSPQDGISLWKQYIDPLKTQGYYLISPACTNDQTGLDWMQSFVEGCTDCTIDAIAFHFYGTDPRAFVEHATTLHETYNKPIWVTEFADQNFSGSGGQASMPDIYAFQSSVIEFVENTPWIEAAFPFGVMHDMQGVDEWNALLTEDEWPTSLAYNYFG